MASRLLNDPVSVRGALRGTQRRRWLPHRFADGVLRRCRAGSYSQSPLRAIAGSGRLGALRLSHRVQHLPWPQSFCQDAAGECQRRSSAAADLPLLSAICLFCSRLCVWAAPVSPPACSRTAGCRIPADRVWRPVSHLKPALHRLPLAARQRCSLQEDHYLPGGRQGQERVPGALLAPPDASRSPTGAAECWPSRCHCVPIRLPLHYPPITLLHAWCRCACWIWSMACRCRFGTRR